MARTPRSTAVTIAIALVVGVGLMAVVAARHRARTEPTSPTAVISTPAPDATPSATAADATGTTTAPPTSADAAVDPSLDATLDSLDKDLAGIDAESTAAADAARNETDPSK